MGVGVRGQMVQAVMRGWRAMKQVARCKCRSTLYQTQQPVAQGLTARGRPRPSGRMHGSKCYKHACHCYPSRHTTHLKLKGRFDPVIQGGLKVPFSTQLPCQQISLVLGPHSGQNVRSHPDLSSSPEFLHFLCDSMIR